MNDTPNEKEKRSLPAVAHTMDAIRTIALCVASAVAAALSVYAWLDNVVRTEMQRPVSRSWDEATKGVLEKTDGFLVVDASRAQGGMIYRIELFDSGGPIATLGSVHSGAGLAGSMTVPVPRGTSWRIAVSEGAPQLGQGRTTIYWIGTD